MLKDIQDLAVTSVSPIAIVHLNDFVQQALGYGKDAEVAISQALAADPSCAIAHAYAAAHFLSQENAVDRSQAIRHLQSAQQYARQATQREQWYIQAIAAWAAGAIDRAIQWHEAIAQSYPQDLISVQQGQYHYFYRGEATNLKRLAETVLPANANNHYLYGMLAFGLEQCGALQQAETIGRRAVTMNRHDSWAQHAVAHVLETQGRVAEGIAWMEHHADTWVACNSMLLTHNWWHVALYYLKQGDWQTVLELYDTRVWGHARKETPKDQVGAIALLLRLELQGVDVGDRWQALSSYLRFRLHEHALPFQDLHALYAMARAGKMAWVAEMLDSLQAHAQTVDRSQRRAWLEVAVPTAQGLIAHAQADWGLAATTLKPVMHRLQELGGSHTQRALFKQIYQNAQRHATTSVRLHPAIMSRQLLIAV
ncbi:MAG: tetratricopeptide repeat protein [Stenomitos rutilans HA7619-LM2]|jgi:tetratricopeptide (TPR) repeat protein|nr:tetratricopeptide repeat protein [Stenomitos rutilans HA7619-LM2]